MASGSCFEENERDFFTWTAPGGALSIHFSLALVNRLEAHCTRLASEPARQEAAGVLFGHSRLAVRADVFIQDYVVLHEPDDANPGFRGELLVQRLGALAQRASSTRKPIGFYRWQRGGSMRLSQADLDTADGFFNQPQDIVLLVRNSLQGQDAAFFWREGGRIAFRDARFIFPLNAARLSRPNGTGRAPDPRETGSTPLHGPARWIPLAHTAAVAMILTVAGVAVLSNTQSPAPALPEPDMHQTSLGLRVTAQPGQLAIDWNHDGPEAGSAQQAMLRIVDGPATQTTKLTGEQIRDGYVAYLPSTPDVSIRLEIHARGGETTTQSVRFIGSVKADLQPPRS